jgi:hypothetical protein
MPIDRLRSHVIGFDELSAGFDRLDDGDAVRQVLKVGWGRLRRASPEPSGKQT